VALREWVVSLESSLASFILWCALEEAVACYLDYVTSYTCTPSVCVCVCKGEHVCVHAHVDPCVCALHSACVNSSSWRPKTDARLGWVLAQRQTWLYMIKCLLKWDGASVGIKSGGRREDTEWEAVWQKQANSVERKRALERLTDRRVRIIDRGSDRESMWWWDNRQIDELRQGAEGEEHGRGKRRLFVQSWKNGASEALCLPLQLSLPLSVQEREAEILKLTLVYNAATLSQ